MRLSLSPSKAVQLWSVARPFLHVALVSVRVGGATGQVVDAFNVSYGVRDIRLDPDQGMFINRQHVKMRGFLSLSHSHTDTHSDTLTHSLTHSLIHTHD